MLAVVCLLSFVDRGSAQTTYVWNNSGLDWALAGSWNSAGGPPTSIDTVLFNPESSSPLLPILQPEINASFSMLSLTIAPTPMLSGWSFTGSGSLTIGGAGSTGLTTYGPGVYTFDGPTLQGAGTGGDALAFTITNGSSLVLKGTSSAVTNIASPLVIAGGNLVIDNAANNSTIRLLNTTELTFRGGTLELRGNSSDVTAFSLGALIGSTTTGINTIRLVPNGNPLSVNFNNAGSVSLRLSTGAIWKFEASSGLLGGGGINDPKITFTGTIVVGTNGLISHLASPSTTFGFAIVSDAGGIDFATWNSTDGVKAAGANLSSSFADGTGSISTGSNVSRGLYTPAAGTQSASAAITIGTLKIVPAAGAVLHMGSFNLVTNGLMLDGPNDFTVTGTGLLGGTAARYVYVNDPNTTLFTSQNIAAGVNHTNFIGPGFVVLTGLGSQNTLTSSTQINILGGTLRASAIQIGFATTGSKGLLAFRGGVLEIQNGTNGTGQTADFRRVVGASTGNVAWLGGNGGFSAFGNNASVNLGGNAVPTSLQWNGGSFVPDGYALIFGSTKADKAITFWNPIQLSNGTAYQLREINVIGGHDGSRAVLAGVLSGTNVAELLKTGTGILELAADNTYAGISLIKAGQLIVTGQGPNGSGTGTGNVIVYDSATLGGTGRIVGGVTVLPGGTIRGGFVGGGIANAIGNLTIDNGVSLNAAIGNGAALAISVNRVSDSQLDASLLKLTGTSHFFDLSNIDGSSGSRFRILFDTTSLLVGDTFTIKIVEIDDVAGGGNNSGVRINGTFLDVSSSNASLAATEFELLTADSYVGFNDVALFVNQSDGDLYLTFTLTPEPSHLFLVCSPLLIWLAWKRKRFPKLA